MSWIDIGKVGIGNIQYLYFPVAITINNPVTAHFNIDTNSVSAIVFEQQLERSLNRLLIYRDLKDTNNFIYSQYLGLFYIQNRNEVLTFPGFDNNAFVDYRIRVKRLINRRQTSFFIDVSLKIFEQSNDSTTNENNLTDNPNPPIDQIPANNNKNK